MTKEEIINNLELYTVGRPKKDRVSITVEELQNLIDEIKALEQPTSNDCVSREDVLEMFGYETAIYDLPPVTPTQCIAAIRFSKDDLRKICNERIEVECTHGTCKDCKHRDPEDKKCDCGHTIQWQLPREDNWYCKDFENRGDLDGI